MPEVSTLPNGMQVIGGPPAEEVPASGYPREFINFVRGFPGHMDATYRDEIARLAQNPEVKQHLASRNLSPKEQFALVQQQAAVNAQKITRANFQQMRQKYGIDTFTPDSLRAAVRANRGALSADKKVADAAAKAGGDAAKDYAEKVLPADVENEVGRLSPYLPFDGPAPGSQKEPKAAPATTTPKTKAQKAEDKRVSAMVSAAKNEADQRANARAMRIPQGGFAPPEYQPSPEEQAAMANAAPYGPSTATAVPVPQGTYAPPVYEPSPQERQAMDQGAPIMMSDQTAVKPDEEEDNGNA
jgi:hypothetical protein